MDNTGMEYFIGMEPPVPIHENVNRPQYPLVPRQYEPQQQDLEELKATQARRDAFQIAIIRSLLQQMTEEAHGTPTR